MLDNIDVADELDLLLNGAVKKPDPGSVTSAPTFVEALTGLQSR